MKKILNAIQAVNNSDIQADTKQDIINELVNAGKGKVQAQEEKEDAFDFITLSDIESRLDTIIQDLGNYLFARQEGTIEKVIALNLLSDLNDLNTDIEEQIEVEHLRKCRQEIRKANR